MTPGGPGRGGPDDDRSARSRDPSGPDGHGDPDEPQGIETPTPPAQLAAIAVGGLVLGWLLHPLTDRLGTPPLVSWVQPLTLAVVAAVVGYVAWATWRALHVRRERLAPAQAVNRLVLARACAYVGALAAGVYAGYALSWVGSAAELADQRILRAGLAAAAGAGIVVGALLLERACRVRSGRRDH